MKKRFLGILLSFALMLTMMPVLGLSQTAKATTTTTVTWNSGDFTAGSTTSKDGISIVGGRVLKDSAQVDFCSLDGYRISNGSFTTDLGNFTSVTVTGGSREGGFPGTGWDGNTWTGNSSTVPISGRMTDALGESPWTITFTIAIPTPYPLCVGGTQVTSANASNITGDETVTASYNDETKTLTLNGYNFNGDAKGIDYTGSDNLNIVITGQNSITSNHSQGCIVGLGDFTFSGTGTLSVTGANAFGAIYSSKGITIESGTVTAEGNISGIRAVSGDVTINGGTVTARGRAGIMAEGNGSVKILGGNVTATGNNYGITAGRDIVVNGGRIQATGTYGTGIVASNGATFNGGMIEAIGNKEGAQSTGVSIASAGGHGISSNTVLINEGIESLIASGSDGAIRGTVTNKIAGTGWSDTKVLRVRPRSISTLKVRS